MAFLVVALSSTCSGAWGDELYRLRVVGAPGASDGNQRLTLLLDNHSVGAGEGNPLPITGFSFSIALSPGVSFQSTSLDGTQTSAIVGAAGPFQLRTLTVDGGVVGALVLSSLGELSYPVGEGLPVLHLDLSGWSASATAGFSDLLDPAVPTGLFAGPGLLRPHTTDFGETPAAASALDLGLQWLTPSAPESYEPPEPPPSTDGEESESGGSEAATSCFTPPVACNPCTIEIGEDCCDDLTECGVSSECECPTTFSNGAEPPTPFRTVGPTGDYATIQAAINAIPGISGAPNPAVISVAPGTYGPITIDADVHGFTIYAVAGPTQTTILGPGGTANAPCVYITGSTYGVTLGWVSSDSFDDPQDWNGFTITGGTWNDWGGGVAVDLASGVEIRGNIITANRAAKGGGIGVRGFMDSEETIVIHQNQISGNLCSSPVWQSLGCADRGDGGGIFTWEAGVSIGRNDIRANSIGVTSLNVQGDGGGIAVNGGEFVRICSNLIRENRARHGAGAFLYGCINSTLDPTSIGCFHVEDNVFRLNDAHESGIATGNPYQGGGLYVGDEGEGGVVHVWNNQFVTNDIQPTTVSPPAAEGGGIYVSTAFAYPTLIGNAVVDNRAQLGAGLFYRSGSQFDTRFRPIWSNTFRANAQQVGVGAGVYLADQSVFCGSSNVVFENVPRADQWYAACCQWSPPWRFSQLQEWIGIGGFSSCRCILLGCATQEWDLRGTANGSTDPNFLGNIDWRLSTFTSPCVDTGDAALESSLPIATDVEDQDARSIDMPGGTVRLDRGADEHFSLQFVRGDATADASLSISDPIHILAVLFTPGTIPLNCQDAMDANDDGGVNNADAVWVLGYLFSGGPPPPPPFPACGLDPTDDGPANDLPLCRGFVTGCP